MNATPIRIQLPPVIESSYGAYVKLRGAPDDLKKLGIEWASRVCQDPIRTTLVQFLGSQLVTVRAVLKKDAPAPPIGMLRAMRMGPEEERRYDEATHVVLVNAQFPLRHPPVNVFGGLAMANGLAASFDGVVIDPEMPRLLPVQSLQEPLPSDGRVILVKHIVCPMSSSDNGAMWMTTAGMRRFGLPNFEMRSIPPNLDEVLPVMNSVAHRVLHEALTQVWQAGDRALTEIALPAEITVTQENMVAAFGRGNASAGQATVRLSFDGKGRGTMEPFITVGPPSSYRGELGEWYYAMLNEFLGTPAQRAPVVRPTGDDALERAHVRAVSEWPGVKDRFVRGLSPQQRLFVKRGFPVGGGGSEFMWVAVVGLQNGQVLGMLANDSSYEKDLRAGKRVSFAEGDIFDWMLMDGKRREGGYSIEALTPS